MNRIFNNQLFLLDKLNASNNLQSFLCRMLPGRCYPLTLAFSTQILVCPQCQRAAPFHTNLLQHQPHREDLRRDRWTHRRTRSAICHLRSADSLASRTRNAENCTRNPKRSSFEGSLTELNARGDTILCHKPMGCIGFQAYLLLCPFQAIVHTISTVIRIFQVWLSWQVKATPLS